MNTASIIQKLEDTFHALIEEVDIRSIHRVTIVIHSDTLTEIAKVLLFEMDFRFVIASAYQTKVGFEILYHFSFDSLGLIINIKVLLPEDHPEIDSLCPLLVAANWIEREIHELYGINFINHPNLEKLISDGNWASGVYPYRNKEKGKG